MAVQSSAAQRQARASRRGRAGALALGLLLAASAPGRPAPAPAPPAAPLTLDPALAGQAHPAPLASTNKIPLAWAVRHAVSSHPEVNALANRYHRASADAAGIQPDSPEVRVGYDRGRDTRHGWSEQHERGSRVRSSAETFYESAEQLSTARQFSRAEDGDPLNPAQRSVEDSQGRDSSRSAGTQQTQSQATETEATRAVDRQRQTEDGMSVELRLRPPNPWELRSARAAGRAAATAGEAELLTAERELGCDIVEAAVRLHYHERMARVQRAFAQRAATVRQELEAAFAAGTLAPGDYAPACRAAASARAGQQRLESKAAELRGALLRLTGLEADRLDLAPLARAPLCPFPLREVSPGAEALAASLAAAHPAVLAVRWSGQARQAEWREARAVQRPWFSHLAAGCAWWDGERQGDGTFESYGDESATASRRSAETGAESSRSRSIETEQPSGDVTRRAESGRRSSARQTDSTEYSQETSTRSGFESSRDENDGHEWWVEVGVEIPIFEWLSDETGARRRAAISARHAGERVEARVRQEILAAMAAARAGAGSLRQARRRAENQFARLKPLISAARLQAPAGDLEALRIEESMVEVTLLVLEEAMREALARLEGARAAGLSPALE